MTKKTAKIIFFQNYEKNGFFCRDRGGDLGYVEDTRNHFLGLANSKQNITKSIGQFPPPSDAIFTLHKWQNFKTNYTVRGFVPIYWAEMSDIIYLARNELQSSSAFSKWLQNVFMTLRSCDIILFFCGNRGGGGSFVHFANFWPHHLNMPNF